MDVIDFVIQEDPATKTYGIDLIINGGTVQAGAILNLAWFLNSRNVAYSRYVLYTCSCGVPECAGYWNDIEVTKSAFGVKWEVPPDSGYLLQNKYLFDASQYALTLDRLANTVRSRRKQGWRHRSELDAIEPEELVSEKDLESHDTRVLEILKRVQSFRSALELNYPEWVSAKFSFSFKGTLSAQVLSFEELLSSIVRYWPDAGYQYVDEDKENIRTPEYFVKLAQQVISAIQSNNFEEINALIYSNFSADAFDKEQGALYFVDYDLNKKYPNADSLQSLCIAKLS